MGLYKKIFCWTAGKDHSTGAIAGNLEGSASVSADPPSQQQVGGQFTVTLKVDLKVMPGVSNRAFVWDLSADDEILSAPRGADVRAEPGKKYQILIRLDANGHKEAVLTYDCLKAGTTQLAFSIVRKPEHQEAQTLDIGLQLTCTAADPGPAPNQAPRITPPAPDPSPIPPGAPRSYLPTAVDPDGDKTVWELLIHPEGMTINPNTGEIQWTPQSDQTGTHPVRIRVSDGRGGVAEADFTVTVAAAPPPPVEPLTLTASVVNPLAAPGVDPGFAFRIVNPNGVAATGVNLTISQDALGVAFSPITAPSGWTCVTTLVQIVCNAAEIVAGAAVDFAIVTGTSQVGVPRVNVEAILSAVSPPTLRTSPVSSTMNAPFVQVTKVHAINNDRNATFQLAPGLTVAYTITVANVGSAPATSFDIRDRMHEHLRFAGSNPPGACAPDMGPNDLVCSFTNLAPGASFSFQVLAQPTRTGTLDNLAWEVDVQPHQGAARMMGEFNQTFTTITSPDITSLTVSSQDSLIVRGNTANVTVTAHISDGQQLDWTQFSTWSSTDLTVADVSTDFGSRGIIRGLANGTATILIVDPSSGKSVGVFVTVDEPPTAVFSADCPRVLCQFDGSSSSDNGTIATYHWDFGDGSTATVNTPTFGHHYAAPGTYHVTLTVTDNVGLTATTSLDVTAIGQMPVASFTHECTDRACTFDASGSTDADGEIVSYVWDFGDGTVDAGSQVEHTYPADGTYTVRLRVEDNDGLITTISSQVTVTAVLSSATLYMTRSAGPTPLPWLFSVRHDSSAGTVTMLPPLAFGGTQPGPMAGGNTILAVADQGDNTLSNTSTVHFFVPDQAGNWVLDVIVPLDANFVRDLVFDPAGRFLWVSYSKAVFGGIEEHLGRDRRRDQDRGHTAQPRRHVHQARCEPRRGAAVPVFPQPDRKCAGHLVLRRERQPRSTIFAIRAASKRSGRAGADRVRRHERGHAVRSETG
jgi:PKD repeat protein